MIGGQPDDKAERQRKYRQELDEQLRLKQELKQKQVEKNLGHYRIPSRGASAADAPQSGGEQVGLFSGMSRPENDTERRVREAAYKRALDEQEAHTRKPSAPGTQSLPQQSPAEPIILQNPQQNSPQLLQPQGSQLPTAGFAAPPDLQPPPAMDTALLSPDQLAAYYAQQHAYMQRLQQQFQQQQSQLNPAPGVQFQEPSLAPALPPAPGMPEMAGAPLPLQPPFQAHPSAWGNSPPFVPPSPTNHLAGIQALQQQNLQQAQVSSLVGGTAPQLWQHSPQWGAAAGFQSSPGQSPNAAALHHHQQQQLQLHLQQQQQQLQLQQPPPPSQERQSGAGLPQTPVHPPPAVAICDSIGVSDAELRSQAQAKQRQYKEELDRLQKEKEQAQGPASNAQEPKQPQVHSDRSSSAGGSERPVTKWINGRPVVASAEDIEHLRKQKEAQAQMRRDLEEQQRQKAELTRREKEDRLREERALEVKIEEERRREENERQPKSKAPPAPTDVASDARGDQVPKTPPPAENNAAEAAKGPTPFAVAAVPSHEEDSDCVIFGRPPAQRQQSSSAVSMSSIPSVMSAAPPSAGQSGYSGHPHHHHHQHQHQHHPAPSDYSHPVPPPYPQPQPPLHHYYYHPPGPPPGYYPPPFPYSVAMPPTQGTPYQQGTPQMQGSAAYDHNHRTDVPPSPHYGPPPYTHQHSEPASAPDDAAAHSPHEEYAPREVPQAETPTNHAVSSGTCPDCGHNEQGASKFCKMTGALHSFPYTATDSPLGGTVPPPAALAAPVSSEADDEAVVSTLPMLTPVEPSDGQGVEEDGSPSSPVNALFHGHELVDVSQSLDATTTFVYPDPSAAVPAGGGVLPVKVEQLRTSMLAEGYTALCGSASASTTPSSVGGVSVAPAGLREAHSTAVLTMHTLSAAGERRQHSAAAGASDAAEAKDESLAAAAQTRKKKKKKKQREEFSDEDTVISELEGEDIQRVVLSHLPDEVLKQSLPFEGRPSTVTSVGRYARTPRSGDDGYDDGTCPKVEVRQQVGPLVTAEALELASRAASAGNQMPKRYDQADHCSAWGGLRGPAPSTLPSPHPSHRSSPACSRSSTTTVTATYKAMHVKKTHVSEKHSAPQNDPQKGAPARTPVRAVGGRLSPIEAAPKPPMLGELHTTPLQDRADRYGRPYSAPIRGTLPEICDLSDSVGALRTVSLSRTARPRTLVEALAVDATMPMSDPLALKNRSIADLSPGHTLTRSTSLTTVTLKSSSGMRLELPPS